MPADQTTDLALRVRGLTKSFDGLTVLRGVDVDVARGSILALLGTNGAGKTTLIRILSTLLRADAGSVAVDGFDVATQPARVRASISPQAVPGSVPWRRLELPGNREYLRRLA